MKKKEGNILYPTVGFFIILMCTILVLYGSKKEEISSTKRMIDDGQLASNLSAATINLEEYGATSTIVNTDFNNSYNEFLRALKNNLRLDNSFNPLNTNSNGINGKVNIESFIIYNVIGNDIEVNKCDSVGNITKDIITSGLGSSKTPNGVLIESTTVYSKISFPLKGYLNSDSIIVNNESVVDITDK